LNGWFYERLIEKDRAPETLIQLTECLRPEMESGYSNFYKIIGESEIEPGGQLMFYLKRNFMRIESPELAHQYLSNWGREKFKFFEINGKFDAVFIYKFEAGNKVDERLLKCKQ
jgi:hypothetical protein